MIGTRLSHSYFRLLITLSVTEMDPYFPIAPKRGFTFQLSNSSAGASPVKIFVVVRLALDKRIGPYSQAIRAGNTLYLAGQIALDPITGKMVTGDIKTQTHQVLKNIQAILDAAGFTLNDVVQCQVFLTDLNYYRDMNEVYAEYFEKNLPARAVIQVSRIPRDGLLEIMMIAVKSCPAQKLK